MKKGSWICLFFVITMVTGVVLSLYGQQQELGIAIAWISLGLILFILYQKS